jgi:hypothetical protein
MKILLRSAYFHVDMAMLVVFWVSAYFIAVRPTLLICNSLLLAVSLAVACAYAPLVWDAWRGQTDPETRHIIKGIFYAWTFDFLWRAWTLLWLTSGQDPAMINNDVVAFLIAGKAYGGILHLTSPGALGTNKPSVRGIAIASVVGASVFIAVTLYATEPNTGWIKDAILPWLPGKV